MIIFPYYCTLFICLVFSTASAVVIHNSIISRRETRDEILRHDPKNTKFFDKDLSNSLQLITPQNIRESYDTVFPDSSFITTGGSYIISKPRNLRISNNDIVNISFYTTTPNSTDWIAAYSPAISDVSTLNDTVPVLYGWADTAFGSQYFSDSSNNNYGRGFLTFNFTNLRANISFVYFTNGLNYPVIMSRSDFTVTFVNLNEPLKPRVMPTSDPNVYNLTWSSYNSTKPTLKWGISSGSYPNSVDANTSSIDRSDVCNDVGDYYSVAKGYGWRDLGLIHTASFHGMVAHSNQKVYYKFGDQATNDFSGEFVLNVAPRAGQQPPYRGTRAVLANDWGRGSKDMTYTWNEYGRPAVRTAECVGNEVLLGNVDVVYVGGDLSYADGYLASWDFFENMMTPVTSGAIFLTTNGNHETDWPNTMALYNDSASSGGECGVVANSLYRQPTVLVDGTNGAWWSYDVGIIHFVGMSTEHNFSIGSAQWQWLKNDLENVNRSITPWIVFGGHRPMYVNSDYCCYDYDSVEECGGISSCIDNSDQAVMFALVQNVEQLLFDNKVNFAFWGHNHVYQRQSAVFNFTVIEESKKKNYDGENVNYYDNPQATVHAVIGSGGANFTENAYPPASPLFPVWNEEFFYEYGYAIIEAVNASHLTYQWVNNTPPYVVMDKVVIYQKDPNSPFNPSGDDDRDTNDDTNDVASTSFTETDVILVGVFGSITLVVIALLFYRYYKSKNDMESDVNSKGSNVSHSTNSTNSSSISNPVVGHRESSLEMPRSNA